MKIVFLDGDSLGRDIDLDKFKGLADFEVFGFSDEKQVRERTEYADFVITCSTPINEKTIGLAKNLKMVCITGTGTNILDLDYLDKKGILWKNVRSYCTQSVAQHTFAMLLYLLENIRFYDDYVRNGEYINDNNSDRFKSNYYEISGKTWGIVGLGEIGREVAKIANAFGVKIIYFSASGKDYHCEYKNVSLDYLLENSDIISVHAPLTEKTIGLFNRKAFEKMKKSPMFLNVGRGAIVVEEDLVYALENNLVKAAGLDVLDKEPMSEETPFLKFIPNNRLLITPHVAWGSVEARTRVMDRIYEYISEYISNENL